MNIVLFSFEELRRPIKPSDSRLKHVLKVLRLSLGDSFRAGIINGPSGLAAFKEQENKITVEFKESSFTPSKKQLILLCGTPRPNSVKRILREGTSLGVSEFIFVDTALGEKSYRDSRVWQSDTIRSHLVEGLSQCYRTMLPTVRRFSSLAASIDQVRSAQKFAFDTENHCQNSISYYLNNLNSEGIPVLAIGSERGWTAKERRVLEQSNFIFLSLGTPTLRTETAVIAAVSQYLGAAKLSSQ